MIGPAARSFAQRQIELVQTFADQAVIAIENVRLFDEVQAKTRDLEEALQQQTATSNVLQVISRSAFDLQAVLTTLAESARDLCGASFVTLFMRDGDAMRLRAESGCTPEIVKFLHEHPIRAGRETFTGRVMLSGEAVHLTDVLADPEYNFGEAPRIGNYRAALGVPLLRNGQVEGVFALARPEPSPFSGRQIEMVRAFADQALIAVENARLFNEVQARTRELAASLDDLRKAQDRLIQSEKLASLGQLTAGIAHEIKNPLNFVNNFSALSRELINEVNDLIAKAALPPAQREEAVELIGMVAANLDKVVSHGKRADSIVKNMLLHSREGSGERTSVNVNAMVEEALNLAYHGARAEKPGFEVTIVKSLDPAAGTVDLYAQEMTRVLLNLISNGFYATAKRRQSETEAYQPDDRRLDPGSRRPRGDRHSRQRNRRSRRGEGQDVPPVLHHQARWRRHRARPVAQLRHRRQAARRDTGRLDRARLFYGVHDGRAVRHRGDDRGGARQQPKDGAARVFPFLRHAGRGRDHGARRGGPISTPTKRQSGRSANRRAGDRGAVSGTGDFDQAIGPPSAL